MKIAGQGHDGGPRTVLFAQTPSPRSGDQLRNTDPRGTTNRFTVPVIMYHSIPRSTSEPGCLPVTTDSFRAQVRTLVEHGATIVGLSQAIAVKTADPDLLVVAVTFDDGYADFMNAAEILEEHGARGTAYVCPGLLDTGHGASSRLRRLAVPDLRELDGRGFEIGSHSMTHRPLDVLTGRELAYEVHRSKAELEQIVGKGIRSFCYPHGYHSRSTRTAVVAAGYQNACIVGRRPADLRGDRYSIPRVEALDDTDAQMFVRRAFHGEPGLTPRLRRAAAPAWTMARRTVRVLTGKLVS